MATYEREQYCSGGDWCPDPMLHLGNVAAIYVRICKRMRKMSDQGFASALNVLSGSLGPGGISLVSPVVIKMTQAIRSPKLPFSMDAVNCVHLWKLPRHWVKAERGQGHPAQMQTDGDGRCSLKPENAGLEQERAGREQACMHTSCKGDVGIPFGQQTALGDYI